MVMSLVESSWSCLRRHRDHAAPNIILVAARRVGHQPVGRVLSMEEVLGQCVHWRLQFGHGSR